MSEKGLASCVAVLVVLSISATAIAADNYRCTLNGLERRVEIVYEPGRAVPCEVLYFKDTEAPGEQQVLWRAQNESGYCESKTEAFIAELRSQGWDCTSSAAEPAEPIPEEPEEPVEPVEPMEPMEPVEPVEPDDTEALAPAEDNN